MQTDDREVAPQEEDPDQDARALGEWGAGRPCAHGAAGSSPSSPRSSGAGGDRACRRVDARTGEESVTQPNSCDGDQAPQQGCGGDTGPTAGPGRGWAQEEAETEGHGWGLQQGLGGSRTASVVPVTGSPVPGGQ